ncbi:phosphoribosylanthranilate isomerase [Fimbriiglobus ruber]|uniref:N-(5'-phosphoribosyl)anthranilate isomerase n=1 Tax=Fimbriiglobus ruber TaxID=1908690 RepID=A0A225DZR3_9BACT|nr:phosphoribosylanthranilate isomerase [Fimbriiglobus ruber]OWK46990.1 Phosphoribosylanthranilate isomerase [Fimbriiglobus ruber]
MHLVRVKICGVTTPAEARFAADCGADALGLNFYPKSSRFITSDQATRIVRELPPFTAAVGVFVEADDIDVVATAARFGLRGVQTYTADPPRTDFHPAAHIPAFRVNDASSLATIRDFVAATLSAGRPPAAVLVDSFVAGEIGGTGHVAPWELLAGFDPGVPLILAGGLTPENVGDAIRAVRPWGVDVASGVEASPGRKDRGKVRAFVQAVRAAAAELAAENRVSG